jgi:hypothetical protein
LSNECRKNILNIRQKTGKSKFQKASPVKYCKTKNNGNQYQFNKIYIIIKILDEPQGEFMTVISLGYPVRDSKGPEKRPLEMIVKQLS